MTIAEAFPHSRPLLNMVPVWRRDGRVQLVLCEFYHPHRHLHHRNATKRLVRGMQVIHKRDNGDNSDDSDADGSGGGGYAGIA